MATLRLPTLDGTLAPVTLTAGLAPAAPERPWTRTAYAAAHVVADPLADIDPWLGAAVDWDRTLAFREHLWRLGFGVAEAMDTAQRGMGLDWPVSIELIRRSVDAAGGRPIASGAGTDHLIPGSDVTIDDVIAAYEMQCEAVEAAGSQVILMASRALTAAARSPDDYMRVYARVLGGLSRPAILHWLGEMFDPALEGYWGSRDHMEAMGTALSVIEANADRVDGIKISLLSAEKEVAMRRRLPAGVRMYSGDDFNYPNLIEGDGQGYSHALLSRHIFRSPTRFYKTGVVFLAYLCGHQDHFTMVGGQESSRSTLHLAEIIRLANDARLFPDPDTVAARARPLFAVRGVEI